MRFSTILSGVVALASLAFAQTTGPNPFQIPAKGYLLTAGQPTTFNWQPTTQGTITLLLKAGPNGNLATILTIACMHSLPVLLYSSIISPTRPAQTNH